MSTRSTSSSDTEHTAPSAAADAQQAGRPSVRLYVHHPRRFQANHYVYPVISRRSRGLSVGVNLNVDKACNFDCVYCSVDRSDVGALPAWATHDVDVARLGAELDEMLDLAVSGGLWHEPPFDTTPPELRRLNDVAMSGDGEPTACPQFAAACRVCAEALDRRGLAEVKLLLLTNATLMERPEVEAGLAVLDGRASEIWAKLDAGTEAYYQLVDRSRITLARVTENLLRAGRRRPLVIQSLFLRLHGAGPPPQEIDAYVARLADLVAGGCRIAKVQVYTVARATAESFATPLEAPVLDGIAARVRRLGLPVETHYGPAGAE